MKHGSLFSGIGGFDLAAQWMGWDNVFHCEWNEFGQKILKYYWPNAISYGDITKTDFTIHRGTIDILTGGFPCQPYSLAGKRKGTEDDRHLWPEMLRAIREIQPRWIVGENVPGLVNWSKGLVFEQVQTDLEDEGYEVQSVILPASGVNAPHKRDRVWIVAYSINNRHNTGRKQEDKKDGIQGEVRQTLDSWKFNGTSVSSATPNSSNINSSIPIQQRGQNKAENINITGQDESGITPNPNIWIGQEHGLQTRGKMPKGTDSKVTPNSDSDIGCKGRVYATEQQEAKRHFSAFDTWQNGRTWENFPTQRPIRMRDDGIPNKLLIFVVKELYDKISNTSKENRIENLPEMWKRISQEEVWEKIRGFYSLESKIILFKTMQLYSGTSYRQNELSPFSEEVSKPILQYLSKHGEFRRSPQGRELGKQREKQFGNSLSFLPHEVALAARRFETQLAKFETWHRNESIKAYGNAIVPQVALQIFKAIQDYENTSY